ncbi:hypothetical protein ST47_g10561 [Ascochyta rabiei]|uniref:Uncharacterized protein n=1 Tax=Didymella rabiei TaxID=5454 RepID=A0A162V816_DIDRA|nr:hypothetical protein ST47_g10561 [Ascochyta rabiei]
MFRDRFRLSTGALSPSSPDADPTEPYPANISITNLSDCEDSATACQEACAPGSPHLQDAATRAPEECPIMAAGDRSWQLDLI